MKKHWFLVLALIVLMGAVSVVSAQDELPSCSPEEYADSLAALGEGFTGLGEMVALPEDAGPADFSAMIVVLDAFDYGYWQGFTESMAEIACAEELYLGRTSGLIIDEMLITNLLSALAVHEDAAGNTELAEILLGQSQARLETTQAGMENLVTTMESLTAGEEVELQAAYPACSEEELTPTVEGMGEIATVYEEFGTEMGAGATGPDLTVLVSSYAELSAQYWAEFYPVIPACQEAQDLVYSFGLLIDDTLITAGLVRLAELEAETGDAEVAQTLAESAAARGEALAEMAALIFGEEEEE